MPVWAYKGVDALGKTVNGTKDADSPKTLRQVMRREGVIVLDVAEAKGGKRTRAGTKAGGKYLGKDVDLGGILRPVSRQEVAAFTRQLSTLLRAGVPLAEALAALFDQIEHPRFKPALGELMTKVNEGSSFADSLAKHPRIFDAIYVSMVRGGEQAGNLEVVLDRLGRFIESQVALRSKITGAMVYPAIMAFIGVIILALLMTMVIPQITQVFSDAGQTLPWNTALLKWTAETFGRWWWLIGGLSTTSLVLFLVWIYSPAGRPPWDSFKLKLPLLGPLIRRIAIARFAGTLGTMLSAGVPLLRALEAARDVIGNVILAKVITNARDQIQQGESIASTLKKSGEFPSMVIHMIAVGERAGQLEAMLDNVAAAYDAEAEMKLARLTGMLTPLMIIIMGLGVGFVVFAILGPMTQMNMLVK